MASLALPYPTTLTGALVNYLNTRDDAAVLYPGEAHADNANIDRPSGTFIVVAGESLANNILTSGNKVYVKTFEVHIYSTEAEDASGLAAFLLPYLKDNSSYVMNSSGVIGVIEESDPLEETTDYAPKGGRRLHKQTLGFRAWVSYPTTR